MEKSYFKGQIRENKISKSETAFQILLWAQDLLIGENKAVCFNKKKQKRARWLLSLYLAVELKLRWKPGASPHEGTVWMKGCKDIRIY